MTLWRSDRVMPVGGLPLLLGSEAIASIVGFGVMVHLARRLGPSEFADFESASAVAAWWLVVVRGGFDTIATREAARHPALVRPLTDVLIGMRLASAAFGLLVVLAWAWASGPGRGGVVLVAGLILIPSAFASDVGFRASGRFGILAVAQVARVLGLAAGAWWLVARPGDAILGAACVAGAECFSTLVLLAHHGPIRPRFRPRAWAAIARRGAVAGATRFGRVSLYALDILALGWWVGPGLGPYAAARRVAFALLALGLVVPTAVAPRLARAWAASPPEAREMISRTIWGLLAIALPATVGLMGTADRWMPRLFGESYREGGPWLALIAARLPFVLVSNVQQAGLIAARREDLAFRLILGMVGLGVVAVPLLAVLDGPWGAGAAALGVEVAGAVAGWLVLEGALFGISSGFTSSFLSLRERAGVRVSALVTMLDDPSANLGDASNAPHPGPLPGGEGGILQTGSGTLRTSLPILAGTAGVAGICRIGSAWPLGMVVVVSLCVYGLTWAGAHRPRLDRGLVP
ncbi:lipopolysaccharide biosynthesis protein [Tundrisphaera lichenicola]|uniref:lipopolysaccharide biosynthesis protein n=1 Tax=Tundrisphaera lichenicola TaxID=2029860 RepID=UPI003EBA5F18